MPKGLYKIVEKFNMALIPPAFLTMFKNTAIFAGGGGGGGDFPLLEITEIFRKNLRIRQRLQKFLSLQHMGREHASREKKLSMVNFLIFVHKNVYRIRF